MSIKLPGGTLAKRPLHFIWILDCSGSMGVDGKIQALNTAIRESLPHMQKVADENPYAQVLIRAVAFSSGARWAIKDPTEISELKWTDLTAEGSTDMGAALALVADSLKMPPMNDRALPPILVLVSDGQPTDDFLHGLELIEAQPWGKKSIRLAIALGADADLDVLLRFTKIKEGIVSANNIDQLTSRIRWASTVVVKDTIAPFQSGEKPKNINDLTNNTDRNNTW